MLSRAGVRGISTGPPWGIVRAVRGIRRDAWRHALLVLAGVAICFTSACGSGPAERAAGEKAPPAPAASPFDRLKGRWLRPDGGYILEIRSISADGTVEASYQNPRPIHVARAQAFREGEALALFVELKDVNYPGSTYRLVYVPSRDVLEGTYFQALQQQTFDVAFVRR